MSTLQSGVIKWFDNRRGFGFIRQSSGKDVFIHYSVIEMKGFRRLDEGEIVYYERQEGEKGPYASRVIKTGVVIQNELTAQSRQGSVLTHSPSAETRTNEGLLA